MSLRHRMRSAVLGASRDRWLRKALAGVEGAHHVTVEGARSWCVRTGSSRTCWQSTRSNRNFNDELRAK